MQERTQRWKYVVWQAGAQVVGATGPSDEHVEPTLVEPADHIAHGLVVAAQFAGNRRRMSPSRRGQHYLAAPEHKCRGRS